MNTHPLVLAAALLTAMTGSALAYETSEIPHTTWPDELPWYEVTPATLQALHPLPGGPLHTTTLVDARSGSGKSIDRGLVLVLVEETLADGLQDSLDLYSSDLLRDGHSVLVESISGGTPEDIKEHLTDLYETDDLVGALLVGYTATPWYEVENDYGSYGYATFPIDLYLMDLDGSWTDQDGNGIYDHHGDGDGDTRPEIWVGHLIVTPQMGDTYDVLEAYFQRNHDYRTGLIQPNGSALVYVDDDWAYWLGEFVWEVENAFDQVTSEAQLNVTSKGDYLPRLEQAYDNVAVFVHSSPDWHYFVLQGNYDEMSWQEVPPQADALFYNLFACSNADWAAPVYMAGVYALQTESGLLAVGSTKTGSMLDGSPYYAELGEYGNFGDAMVRWWGSEYPYNADDRSWFYGMTVVGDPTLRIGFPTIAADPAEIGAEADAGDVAEVALQLRNDGVDQTEWTVEVDGAWIGVDPLEGDLVTAGEELTVTLDSSELAIGTHSGALVITAPGATNSPLELPVEFTVWGEAVICVEPAVVQATLPVDQESVSATVVIRNCADGGGGMAWTGTVDQDWAALGAESGVADGGGQTVELILSRPEAGAGSVTGMLAIASEAADDSPVSVEVVLVLEGEESSTLPDGGGCASCSGNGGSIQIEMAVLLCGGWLFGRRRRP